MTLDQLRVLVKVVESGSFAGAAVVLGLQPSNVSRVIAQLEAQLGVTLLERTTRTQSVSEAGRAVYERAVGVLAAIDDTVRVTRNIQEEPSGVLRVTCGVPFGMEVVGAWIRAYAERFPRTSVEAEFATRDIDIVHEGFDLAIRAGPLASSRLVARALGQIEFGLFASPHYATRKPLAAAADASDPPDLPDLLKSHDLVVFKDDSSKPRWALHHSDGREPVLLNCTPKISVNAGSGVLDAVLGGMGIGQLPLVIAASLVTQGRLLRVLPRWQPAPVAVHAVYPSNRYLTPKVRAFVQLAQENFPRRKD